MPLSRMAVFGLPHRALLSRIKRPIRNHNRFPRFNFFLDRLSKKQIAGVDADVVRPHALNMAVNHSCNHLIISVISIIWEEAKVARSS